MYRDGARDEGVEIFRFVDCWCLAAVHGQKTRLDWVLVQHSQERQGGGRVRIKDCRGGGASLGLDATWAAGGLGKGRYAAGTCGNYTATMYVTIVSSASSRAVSWLCSPRCSLDAVQNRCGDDNQSGDEDEGNDNPFPRGSWRRRSYC